MNKKSKEIRTLESLVTIKFLTETQSMYLMDSIKQNKNIIITGTSGTGKTTLLEAILHYKWRVFPNRKTVILERFPEILKNEVEGKIVSICNDKFGLDEMSFLQQSDEPSQLVIHELTVADDIENLLSGILGGSNILATMHSIDFESCKNRIKLLSTKKQYQTVNQSKYVFVKLSKHKVEDIVENYIDSL